MVTPITFNHEFLIRESNAVRTVCYSCNCM